VTNRAFHFRNNAVCTHYSFWHSWLRNIEAKIARSKEPVMSSTANEITHSNSDEKLLTIGDDINHIWRYHRDEGSRKLSEHLRELNHAEANVSRGLKIIITGGPIACFCAFIMHVYNIFFQRKHERYHKNREVFFQRTRECVLRPSHYEVQAFGSQNVPGHSMSRQRGK